MYSSDILEPSAPRRRRRYDPQFKAEPVAHCRQRGISVASVAQDHGINANLLRRWIQEHERYGEPRLCRGTLTPMNAHRPNLDDLDAYALHEQVRALMAQLGEKDQALIRQQQEILYKDTKIGHTKKAVDHIDGIGELGNVDGLDSFAIQASVWRRP